MRLGFWESVFICLSSLGAGEKEMGGGSIDLKRSYVAQVVNNPPANAGDARDVGSIPGSGRSPGEGNSKQLQYSSLDNSVDRGVRRASPWSHKVTQIYSHGLNR